MLQPALSTPHTKPRDRQSVVIRRVATPHELDDEVRELLDDLDFYAFTAPYSYPIHPKEGGFWWIAFDADHPVGFAGMVPYNEYRSVFMCRCAVLKSHRGQGLQRRFIRVRERQAKQEGYRRAVTYVLLDNVVSANNFIRCGYRLYRPVHIWGMENAVYFQRSLLP